MGEPQVNVNILAGFVFLGLMIAGFVLPAAMPLWGGLFIVACFATYAANRLR